MAGRAFRKKLNEDMAAFEQRVLRRRRGWTVIVAPDVR